MKNQTVVILIFLKDGKILTEKRQLDLFKNPQYLIPGGRVEIAEAPENAATREAFEELGIKISKFKPLPHKEKILGLRGQTLISFIIEEWIGEFPETILDKGTPLFWVDFKEALTSKVKPTREIIIALKRYLS